MRVSVFQAFVRVCMMAAIAIPLAGQVYAADLDGDGYDDDTWEPMPEPEVWWGLHAYNVQTGQHVAINSQAQHAGTGIQFSVGGGAVMWSEITSPALWDSANPFANQQTCKMDLASGVKSVIGSGMGAAQSLYGVDSACVALMDSATGNYGALNWYHDGDVTQLAARSNESGQSDDYVAFKELSPANAGLFLLDKATGTTTRIRELATAVSSLSVIGDDVFYSVYASAARSLYRYGIASQQTTSLGVADATQVRPEVGGNLLICEKDGQIKLLDLLTSTETAITSDASVKVSASITPDGNMISWCSFPGVGHADDASIWCRDLRTGETTLVASGEDAGMIYCRITGNATDGYWVVYDPSTTIPEPSSIALLASAACVGLWFRRKKKRRQFDRQLIHTPGQAVESAAKT